MARFLKSVDPNHMARARARPALCCPSRLAWALSTPGHAPARARRSSMWPWCAERGGKTKCRLGAGDHRRGGLLRPRVPVRGRQPRRRRRLVQRHGPGARAAAPQPAASRPVRPHARARRKHVKYAPNIRSRKKFVHACLVRPAARCAPRRRPHAGGDMSGAARAGLRQQPPLARHRLLHRAHLGAVPNRARIRVATLRGPPGRLAAGSPALGWAPSSPPRSTAGASRTRAPCLVACT
jgi:hypothetical protein